MLNHRLDEITDSGSKNNWQAGNVKAFYNGIGQMTVYASNHQKRSQDQSGSLGSDLIMTNTV